METQSVNYGERVDLRRVNLLALVLNFEKYWQSYSLSDGILYATEVREEAQKIIPLFYEIYGKKKASAISSNETVYVDEIRDFIKELERWLSKGTTFPKRVAGREYTSRSNFMFQYLFIIFEDQLQSEIGLPIRMELSATPHEDYFRRKQMKWAGQIPEDLVERAMDPDFIDRMSRADTLVMVADIRRSQDLITYGSTIFYRERIMGFLDKVRKILREDYGIYDRFTGDGFIAYFNQFVCEQEGRDYYEMALDACHRIQSFSQQYFDEWSNLIRKVPIEPIGLSIGIDSGEVSFKDIEGQFFAIGDACVWATRMCNAGKRGQVVFNNIPFHRISQFGSKGFCEEIEAISKNGETFRAFSIIPSLVAYKSQPKKDPSLDKPSVIK